MSEFVLGAQTPLQRLMKAGMFGKTVPVPAVTFNEVADLGLANVTLRKGAKAVFAAEVRRAFSIDVPFAPRRVAASDVAFVATGFGQWLVTASGVAAGGMERKLERLSPSAAIVDQSDARAIIRIAGPKARDTLMKGLAVDLDPRVFKTGDAAVTPLSHMGATLWQVSDEPAYEIAVFRSFAESFWGFLTSSAAQYGYSVET